MEIWKDVIGFESLFQVSNYGRVKSKARIHIRKNGRPQTIRSKILTQRDRGMSGRRKAYKSVFLTNGDDDFKGKYHPVHRLVAMAFIANPYNLKQVNHIDSDRFNNNVNNLEWCSNRGNQIHSVLQGRRNHLMKKIAILSITGEPIMYVSSIKTASTITGANRTAIREVILGRNSHAKGFKFGHI